MQISEVMTRDVRIASPEDTLQKAAGMMADLDIGVLPVGDGDRLVGVLTDRDITVRAVAQGKVPADCKVRDVMSSDLKYCFEDQSTDEIARNMADLQVRRLPVVNREKRLVGIVALGDLATSAAQGEAGAALGGVSRGAHH